MANERVQGLQHLLDKMEGLKLNMQKTLIVRALRKACAPIKEAAEEAAPDDPNTAGSRIRDNIIIVVSEQTAHGSIAKIGPARRGFMGRFHEHGTKFMARRPWLEPAFDRAKPEALRILGQTLAEGIETELRKGK